jgi:hypothetical protein
MVTTIVQHDTRAAQFFPSRQRSIVTQRKRRPNLVAATSQHCPLEPPVASLQSRASSFEEFEFEGKAPTHRRAVAKLIESGREGVSSLAEVSNTSFRLGCSEVANTLVLRGPARPSLRNPQACPSSGSNF